MKSCTVILSYIENMTPEFIRSHCPEGSLILCADGGQKIARIAGIQPDVVIGDFDSTGDFERFDCLYITYPVEKDLTDTEACLLYAVEQGCDDILLLGGIGGRLDHTLGNLALLQEFYAPDRKIRFLDPLNSAELLVNSSITIPYDSGYRFFSLVSVEKEAVGITITGAKYNLDNAVLPRTTTLGISNEIVSDRSVITVTDGTLYIIRSSDRS